VGIFSRPHKKPLTIWPSYSTLASPQPVYPVSNDPDLLEFFQLETWSPQCLPQDAYKGAAFYESPKYLQWTVLDANLVFSRQPVSDQEFIRVPFVYYSDGPTELVKNWGIQLLASHIRESSLGTCAYDNFTNEIHNRSLGSNPIIALTFSPDQEITLKRRTETRYPQVRYLSLDPERHGVDPNIALVFSSLGKVVQGNYGCSYGIALCNYSIRVFNLPTAPKTRYNRNIECHERTES
jgi:hypothetical protein